MKLPLSIFSLLAGQACLAAPVIGCSFLWTAQNAPAGVLCAEPLDELSEAGLATALVAHVSSGKVLWCGHANGIYRVAEHAEFTFYPKSRVRKVELVGSGTQGVATIGNAKFKYSRPFPSPFTEKFIAAVFSSAACLAAR